MRHIKITKPALFFIFATFSIGAYAEDDAQQFGRNLPSLLEKLPPSLSKPLQTYLDVIRPDQYNSKRGSDVEDDNPGIMDHFRDMMNEKSPAAQCLNLKTQLFYDYVRDYEIEKPPLNAVQSDIAILPYPKLTPDLSPSLLSKSTDYKKNPGWVWEKAMQLTSGNANEAMRIIGICGHDDIGPRSKEFNPKNFDEKILARLKTTHPVESEIVGQLLACPEQKSSFFAPGSLDESADISQDLKNRIQSLQASGEHPENSIAAKYYHVYASAYVACRMIENGVAPSAAPMYAAKFASVYRRTVTCRATSSSRTVADRINAQYQKALSAHVRAGESSFTVTEFLKSRNIEECKGLLEGSDYQLVLCSDERRKNLSQANFDKITALLFAGKMYNEQQLCPSSKSQSMISPGEMLRVISASGSNSFDFGRSFTCENIPQSICDSAQKILAAWRVDFEWTMAQHKAGAQFGAKNCRVQSETKLKNTCEIPESFFAN